MFSLAVALLLRTSQAPLADVKFELVGNHIYIPATLNGKPMIAIFDSGAGMSALDLGVAEDLKLPSSGVVQAGGIGKQMIQGKILSGAKVRIGEVEKPLMISIPLNNMSKAEGRPMPLIVGYEFFKNNVVEIDYPNRRLRIFAAGWNPGGGTAVPMRVVGNHPHVTTEMIAGGSSYKLETLIDTGASGGGLSVRFLNKNKIGLTRSEKTVIGGGVGGFIEGRYFRPSAIKVADYVAAQPVLTASEAEGGVSAAASDYDLLLGGDILKRFKVTFDYANSKVTFEPSSGLGQPFEADKTGMRLEAQEKNLRSFKVFSIMPGSAAAAAGLQVGDAVETIDGKPASTWSLPELREMFKSSTSTGWDFGIRRNSKAINIHLIAKSII